MNALATEAAKVVAAVQKLIVIKDYDGAIAKLRGFQQFTTGFTGEAIKQLQTVKAAIKVYQDACKD